MNTDSCCNVSTTESAKNPNGQWGTMSATATGKPSFGHPELNSTTAHVISPTSSIGVKQLESR